MQRRFMILMLSALALPAWAAERHYQLRVDGLACAFCAYGLEKKLKALPGVSRESLDIRLNEGLVTFRADADIGEAELKRLVNDAGFTLRGLEIHNPGEEAAP